MGASKPWEYGDYYAWGEIEPYYISKDPLVWNEGKEQGYSFSSYKWGDLYNHTKYCPSYRDYEWAGNGSPDEKSILDLEDDVAHVVLGKGWRMPTDSEFNELITNCSWIWTTINDISGFLVKSKINDNSIYFPAVGYWIGTSFILANREGYYWSSSLYEYEPGNAFRLTLGYGSSAGQVNFFSRCMGHAVRPVSE